MRQWTIDAFAAGPFKGNPACVVEPFDAWPEAAWMQALAAENNQAETAFLLRTDDPSRFGLRWFTPTIEAPLCGHATLAAAHMLFSEAGLDAAQATFDTLSGPLIVGREGGAYAMDFPAAQVRQADPGGALTEALTKALGVRPEEVWIGPYLVAGLKDEAAVRAARPDLSALERVGAEATQGRGNVAVCALAAAGASYEVVSRFFAPGSGIPEDPATGSLHCILSPIYAAKLGGARIAFHQAYPGRGGDLDCELAGDRVILRGAAVTVIESRLRV